jgi:hypothetical protein
MEQDKAKHLKNIENQYLTKNAENLVKLENFKKKIFAVGVYDELQTKKSLSSDQKLKIAQNSMMIRNLVKDLKPEAVVLEMCEDRYDNFYYDIISHPNYDRTMSDIHKILDTGKPEKLLDYKNLEMEKAGLEYLIGMDVCSYRMMPCKTVFGDRSIKITNKRYKSKVKMLEMYKEAVANQ